MKTSTAVLLLAIGLIGLVGGYSFRPPDGFLDALNMLAQGKQNSLTPPIYHLLMAVSGVLALIGGAVVLRRVTKDA